jgi:glucosamine-6-phosphate deaminase
LNIKIFPSKTELAQNAANDAAATICETISQRGEVRILAATGASQFDFLEALTKAPGIDWKRVEMFHLDEYVGLSDEAPASFCKYLRERLIDKVGLGKYHLLNGAQAPADVIERVSAEIRKAPIDIAFAGVGENGHLAFNDPPADFDTEEAYHDQAIDESKRDSLHCAGCEESKCHQSLLRCRGEPGDASIHFAASPKCDTVSGRRVGETSIASGY